MEKTKKSSGGSGSLKSILISLLVTVIFGGIYFYVALPALNVQSPDFWTFLIALLVVYMVVMLICTGSRVRRGNVTELPKMLKANCKVPLILVGVIVVV